MRMMTVPGVGPIAALTFKAAVDDPARFKRSRTVAAHFGLTPEDAAELVNAASEKAEALISAYDFTKILHERLSHDEKARIVELLWLIAYADGRLDKYEDSLVLKISDLLHVSRGRVMRLKHDAAHASGA